MNFPDLGDESTDPHKTLSALAHIIPPFRAVSLTGCGVCPSAWLRTMRTTAVSTGVLIALESRCWRYGDSAAMQVDSNPDRPARQETGPGIRGVVLESFSNTNTFHLSFRRKNVTPDSGSGSESSKHLRPGFRRDDGQANGSGKNFEADY